MLKLLVSAGLAQAHPNYVHRFTPPLVPRSTFTRPEEEVNTVAKENFKMEHLLHCDRRSLGKVPPTSFTTMLMTGYHCY